MTQPSIVEPGSDQVLPDPVLSDYTFPLRQIFYPLGFPLELATDSEHVIQAASENWGSFTQAFDLPPMRLCLGVTPGDTTRLPPQSKFRSREHLMSIIADQDNFVVCDFNQNFAYGWVTQAVASNHPVLRYRFLSAAVLILADQMALAPLHAALIQRNGRGVALVGDSFAGKSTLAYACARAGWTFITDDGAHLLRNRSDRYAIGDPCTIRLRESARRLFPELADRLPVTRANGKVGLEVFTRDLPISTATGCSIDHVVFLNRNEPGPTRLRHYPVDEALEWCQRVITYGTAEVRAAQKLCYRRLSGAGIWELRYQDCDDAIVRLEQLVDSGS